MANIENVAVPSNTDIDVLEVTQGIVPIPGPKGDKGDTGAIGPQGPKGDKGDQGATGQTGAVGATGPQGERGDTGSAGPIGPAGARGADGLAGPAGERGLQGERGDAGPPGERGPQGEPGLQGLKGDTGSTGATGAKGDTGAAGPGVATNGAQSFILSKASASDFDTTWSDVNDLVDWERISTMINQAIADNGGSNTDPGGGGDSGGGDTSGGIGSSLLTTRWTANGLTSPITPSGHFSVPFMLSGDNATADGNLLVLNKETYLDAKDLAFALKTDSDTDKTQTPAVFRVGFKGKVGPDTSCLVDLSEWAMGQFTFSTSWTGTNLRVTFGRSGNGELIDSDNAAMNFGSNELYEAEWRNDPAGAGGFMRFYIGGVQIGSEKSTTMKFRSTDEMRLCVNATLGNTSGSVNGLEVEYVELSYQAS